MHLHNTFYHFPPEILDEHLKFTGMSKLGQNPIKYIWREWGCDCGSETSEDRGGLQTCPVCGWPMGFYIDIIHEYTDMNKGDIHECVAGGSIRSAVQKSFQTTPRYLLHKSIPSQHDNFTQPV